MNNQSTTNQENNNEQTPRSKRKCTNGIEGRKFSPVEEIYKLEAELVVDVLLRHLRVHFRRHHKSKEELVHQLFKFMFKIKLDTMLEAKVGHRVRFHVSSDVCAQDQVGYARVKYMLWSTPTSWPPRRLLPSAPQKSKKELVHQLFQFYFKLEVAVQHQDGYYVGA